jgi:hypothetical protein
LGNFLLTIGTLVACCPGPLLLSAATALFVIEYYFIVRAEEYSLAASLGSTYASYRSRVPALLPFKRPVQSRDEPASIRFSLARARGELSTIVVLVLAFFLIIGRSRWLP